MREVMSDRELADVISRNEVRCDECGGSGELFTSHRFACYECGGSGKILPPDVKKLVAALRESNRLREAVRDGRQDQSQQG